MKRETLIALCGTAFIVMLIVAICHNHDVQTATDEALHEIKTADIWQQAAYPCPTGAGQGYYPQYQGQGAPNQPVAFQEIVPQPDMALQPAALNAANGAPPIYAGQDKPVLIKQWGAEVMPVGGGKVKITGVMGASWADKAGLKAGDIILAFDTKKITSLAQFQDIVAKAPPEKDYKVDYMRNGQKKKCLVTVGEGEMEGFTPIPVPK
ncbi:MAG: PDZ domain-containing protein [Candidatus Omnitrophica bacterium]|nr:PDZ domain-containing protein [Candidatus Omnitrophota bacterium]